jgi:DNA-binding transcriptional LysR family regulator
MNIQNLKYFITVSQCLNFSKAANELFITQPTLSHCISTLEKELDVVLFIRNKKSVRLTKEGEIFQQAAQEIVENYETALKKIRAISTERGRALKTGFLGSPFYQYFPRWIPAFRSAYPKVEISLQIYNRPQFCDAFENDFIDIGFARKIELGAYNDVYYEKLCNDRLTVAVHCNSEYAQRKVICLSELRDIPFILVEQALSPNYFNKIMQVCASRNFMPTKYHTTSNTWAIYQLLSAGMGVAILPSSSISLNYPLIRYIEISESDRLNEDESSNLDLEAGAVWKKSNKNPNIDAFLDVIKEQMS